jgi:hypothetical protein
MSRKNIDANISKRLAEEDLLSVESTIIEEYKELNDKCDTVITKIKKRKNSKLKAVPNV